MNLVATRQNDREETAKIACSYWNASEAAELLLKRVLHQAEKDERDLAYYTACKSEQARKQSGSYYTPVDVAQFFWNQFFDAKGINDAQSATDFLRTHRLIEPSCGSGVLVYALLAKLLAFGVPLEVMRDLDLHLVDLNDSALQYSRLQFSLINKALGGRYFSPSFEHTDFLRYDGLCSERPVIIFGNPPFVSNAIGKTWKNTYADFMDRCLEEAAPLAAIHFIVPLSLSFSRDYSRLRNKLRTKKFSIYASHFDNIPDTLFKSGKPQNSNSNKSNSQRCTIISVLASSEHRLLSSKMHRWNTSDRATLLSSPAHFEDVTNYQFGDQFIRPSSPEMARYLQNQNFEYFLGDLTAPQGPFNLYVGGVARNYISVRGGAGNGIQRFSFENRLNFYRFLGIIASREFMDYWRTVGDGFHVTRSNIVDFPVSASFNVLLEEAIPKVKSMWIRRARFEKMKLNSGTLVCSYDFSSAAISLTPSIPNKKQSRMVKDVYS